MTYCLGILLPHGLVLASDSRSNAGVDQVAHVQIGDVPGRKEPGTGETNYPHIFRILREIGYNGYLDTEHGTTSTPEHAIDVVKRLSAEN